MKAIGIDLGTTNSVAAYCELGRRDPRVLATSAGENLTPSVVSLRRSKRSPDGERLVGRAALNYAPSAPEDTIFSIKRLMGRDFADPAIAQVRKTFNYKVVRGPNEDPRAHVEFGGATRTPIQISAMILGKVKEDAEKFLGEAVTHAVITVPAYFNEGQRAATREAGEQAGLVVKKIIDEPTAAAIAFGVQMQPGDRHRILVYDLGGGTFDISILQMVRDQQGRDQFQVMQIEGDNWLGGDDFDQRIVEKIIRSMKAEYKVDPSGDKKFLLLAKSKAEEVKRALSQAVEADIVIPAAYRTDQGVMVDVEATVTRDEFEGMIRSYVDKSMELVRKALAQQNLTPEDVSDVLLVGGSTLVPLVYQAVENVFGKGKVRRNINPMECVALGASVLAATLRGVECPNSQCKEHTQELVRMLREGISQDRRRAAIEIGRLAIRTRGVSPTRGSISAPQKCEFPGDYQSYLDAAMAAFRDANPEVRQEAAHTLGEWGDEAVVTILQRIVLPTDGQPADHDAKVRIAATRALGRVGGTDAVKILEKLAIEDANEDVRFNAVNSLASLAIREHERHKQAPPQPAVRTRGAAVRTRGASPVRNISKEAQTILNLLEQVRSNDPSWYVREKADEALADLGE